MTDEPASIPHIPRMDEILADERVTSRRIRGKRVTNEIRQVAFKR